MVDLGGPVGGAHRGRRKLWVVMACACVFAAGAFAQWVIGKGADATAERISPDLHVSLFSDPQSFPAFDVVIPTPADSLVGQSSDNSGIAVTRWAEGMGGAAADKVTFDLEVFGNADHPVVITGISAVANCKKVKSDVPRTLVSLGQAGPFYGRVVHLDLDAKSPAAKPVPTDDFGEWSFPLQVSRADAERIVVIAETGQDCTFSIDVSFKSSGSKGHVGIDHDGEPFRVTSSSLVSDTVYWRIRGETAEVSVTQN